MTETITIYRIMEEVQNLSRILGKFLICYSGVRAIFFLLLLTLSKPSFVLMDSADNEMLQE